MADLFAIDGFNSNDPGSDYSEDELDVYSKLQLSERGNEIYRQQIRYMQDHVASLRELIQDKENIIENLTLRIDLGILQQEKNDKTKDMDEIQLEDMCQKAKQLAYRTILENFEFREMVYELREEVWHLRFPNKEKAISISDREEEDEDNVVTEEEKENAVTEEDDWGNDNVVAEENVWKDLDDNAIAEEYDHNVAMEEEEENVVTSDEKNNAEMEDEAVTDDHPYIDVGKMKTYLSVEQLRQQVRSLEEELDNLKTKRQSEAETAKAKLKEIEALENKVVKLRRLRVHFAEFRILFGCSFKSLIPYQLNENALMKYGLLFDGYYRNFVDDALIPKEVSKLISFYYPIFWTLGIKRDTDTDDHVFQVW